MLILFDHAYRDAWNAPYSVDKIISRVQIMKFRRFIFNKSVKDRCLCRQAISPSVLFDQDQSDNPIDFLQYTVHHHINASSWYKQSSYNLFFFLCTELNIEVQLIITNQILLTFVHNRLKMRRFYRSWQLLFNKNFILSTSINQLFSLIRLHLNKMLFT